MAEAKRGRPRKVDSEVIENPVDEIQDSPEIEESEEIKPEDLEKESKSEDVLVEESSDKEIQEEIKEVSEEVEKPKEEKSSVCDKCAYPYNSPVCKSCIEYKEAR